MQNPTISPATPDNTLNYVWNSGSYKYCYTIETEPFPLLACRADCDNDGECEGDLLCFSRGPGDLTPVPGCSGVGLAGRDYCYDPNAPTNSPSPRTYQPEELKIVGNDCIPSGSFPLGK